MNDLNLAALQAARQANTSGSHGARTRDADDAAADFDRVMARVSRQDAAAAQRRDASARGDAQRPEDDPAPPPQAAPNGHGEADDAGGAANANAATPVAAQFAAVVVTDDAAAGAAAPDDRACGVDPPSGLKSFAPSAPQAPRNGHRPPASSPADAAADGATAHPAQMRAAPRNAARATAPVAAHAAVADADRPAAAATAGVAPAHAAEPALPRFELAPASAPPALRAENLGVHNPVASAFTPHAPQTHSIAHVRIATPVADPAFGADFANRVVFLAGQRVHSAELSLTPADLGPLAVTIELRGQEAHVFFGATHATTRAAIEDALPRLREMFAGSGLQLADAQIGDHGRRDFARPQRGPAEPMRAIGAMQVAPDRLRPARPAHADRLIDVVV